MTASPETIHERGRAALLAGATEYDVPPGTAGSPRWGSSVILRIDQDAESRLAAIAAEAAEHAGPHHWQTGSVGAAHVTFCAVEDYREGAQADDPQLAAAVAALEQATAGVGPLHFRLGGVALATRGVLVMAHPLDERPDRLRNDVLAALGEQGRYDGDYRRSVWWATALHFAGPLARPDALLDWADARRDTDLGRLTVYAADLVRYEHRIDLVGPRTVPVTLRRFPLAGPA